MPHRQDAILDGIVPDTMLTAYRTLINHGAVSADQAADILGGPDAVSELTRAGLAHLRPGARGADPQLVPAPADLALQGYLADFTQRAIQGFRALKPDRRTTEGDGTFVKVLTDPEEILHIACALINAASRDWMRLDDSLRADPDGPGCAALRPPRSTGVTCRAVYDVRYAHTPEGARAIDQAVLAGEQARLLPRVPVKMKLADAAEALVALTPARTGAALLVRSPTLCGALRGYFDLLWDTAIPYSNDTDADPARVPLTTDQARVLRLLTQGCTDAAIAHRLGISVPTVRRHVTAIRDALGADTRWAAAAAAVRRGWTR